MPGALATGPPGSGRSRRRLGIGQVLAELRPDFPEVSISKIRFLETEGLVEPERTPSGYRKFSSYDIERLRYILAAQRDRYLPLKVIREHLDAMDRGLEPADSAGGPARPPAAAVAMPGEALPVPTELTADPPEIRLSRAELLANSGLTDDQLVAFTGFGLIAPVADTDYFDADALAVASTVAEMSTYGLEARHVRAFKTAADREVGLIEQAVNPQAARRTKEGQQLAADAMAHLGALAVRLHACLVRSGLRRSH